MQNCKLCSYKFTPASPVLKLNIKQDGCTEKIRVCGKCHSAHMSKGE